MYLKSFIFASLITALSSCFLAYGQSHFKKPYEIQDLKALADIGQTHEFFNHIKDILPHNRNQEYNDLVLKMANLEIKNILAKKSVDLADIIKAQEFLEYKFIEQDEFYINTYKLLSLKYLKECFDNNSYLFCEQKLISFWDKDQTHDYGIKLAKIITPYLAKELSQVKDDNGFTGKEPLILEKLYAPSLTHSLSEFYCKEKSVQEVAFSLYLKLKKHDEKTISNLFHPDCIKSLQDNLLSWLYKTPLNQKDLIIKLVDDQTLQKNMNQYIQILKLLNIQTATPELNFAWNTLENLSMNYQTRMKVLKLIKTDPNITLNISQIADNYLTKLRVKHIAKKFPELFKTLNENCKTVVDYTYCNNMTKINNTLSLL